jgi:hypothetical protein
MLRVQTPCYLSPGLGRRRQAEPEKRMDRLALHIDGRHAGRREDDNALAHGGPEVLQQRRLARARAPGEQDVLPRIFECIACRPIVAITSIRLKASGG